MTTKKKIYQMIVDFSLRNQIPFEGKFSSNTLRIGFDDIHKIQFQLRWTSDTHYVVYIVVKKRKDNLSPAIASLWNTSDVVFFLSVVLKLNLIYAMKDNPNDES